jgi:hypothetical protein
MIACEVLVDWLEHSDRYSWVRVEADEAMFLDDIVFMRADGRVEVKQVKFSTNPWGADDPFTWEKLGWKQYWNSHRREVRARRLSPELL